MASVNARTIYRWVEDGMTHFTETAEGRLFVCVASLPVTEATEANAMSGANDPDFA
jgi:hypothetical protein